MRRLIKKRLNMKKVTAFTISLLVVLTVVEPLVVQAADDGPVIQTIEPVQVSSAEIGRASCRERV